MTETFQFEVLGKVYGKQRPRFYNGHAYTPKQTKDYEKQIAESYIGQGGRFYGDRPISLHIGIEIDPPKSWSKKKRSEAIGRSAIKKPDVDNVTKVVMDALEGIAFKNDMQVIEINAYRYYGETEKLGVIIFAYDAIGT